MTLNVRLAIEEEAVLGTSDERPSAVDVVLADPRNDLQLRFGGEFIQFGPELVGDLVADTDSSNNKDATQANSTDTDNVFAETVDKLLSW